MKSQKLLDEVVKLKRQIHEIREQVGELSGELAIATVEGDSKKAKQLFSQIEKLNSDLSVHRSVLQGYSTQIDAIVQQDGEQAARPLRDELEVIFDQKADLTDWLFETAVLLEEKLQEYKALHQKHCEVAYKLNEVNQQYGLTDGVHRHIIRPKAPGQLQAFIKHLAKIKRDMGRLTDTQHWSSIFTEKSLERNYIGNRLDVMEDVA
jgi:chromosome segregation ATPase